MWHTSMWHINFVVIFIIEVLPCAFQLNIEIRHREIPNLDQNVKTDKQAEDVGNNIFPKDFVFGVSTSAPQNEGAWNKNDRGESVWDYMTHANPGLMQDGSNMEVANDFYHKYKEDLRLAKNIGTQMFRLSFSWTRILPHGFINHISRDGIKFYNNLLDEIITNGMIPMVILFHWDLPYNIQKMGGLSNPLFPNWFEQYARFVFATFGDKVKYWLTIYEPNILCNSGYGNLFILPALNMSAIADYLCGHHALLAHARIYHLYDREFRARQKGKVGYLYNFNWFIPMNSSSQEDINAAENTHQWSNYWLINPIFNSTGDYPCLMKKWIARNSREQGFSASRLPKFTKEQIRDIRGTADFLGVNYFTYRMAKAQNKKSYNIVSYENDAEMVPDVFNIKDSPSLFGKLLQRINKDYNLPIIYITANGFEFADLNDVPKVQYLQGHLAEILKAIRSGMDIRGYLYYTLLDQIEWRFGYKRRYGLFHIDTNNANLTRTPRLSSKFIARVYKSRRLEEMLDYVNPHASKTAM